MSQWGDSFNEGEGQLCQAFFLHHVSVIFLHVCLCFLYSISDFPNLFFSFVTLSSSVLFFLRCFLLAFPFLKGTHRFTLYRRNSPFHLQPSSNILQFTLRDRISLSQATSRRNWSIHGMSAELRLAFPMFVVIKDRESRMD